MPKRNPPFLADQAGSLIRPPELIQARRRFRNGEISAEQLRILTQGWFTAMRLQRLSDGLN